MDNAEPEPRGPRLSVGVDMKINLGNYESMGGSVMLSGVEPGATADEVMEMLETGNLVYDILRDKLTAKLNAAKKERTARP